MHCEHTIFVMPPEGLAGISNAVFIKSFWKLLFEIFASKHLHLLWTQHCCALYRVLISSVIISLYLANCDELKILQYIAFLYTYQFPVTPKYNQYQAKEAT